MAPVSEGQLKIPSHIAFIVDGNRRWAKEKGLPTLEGHRRGFNNLEKVLDACRERGVKAVTAWVFSTENWNRSKEEVSYLFDMFRKDVQRYKQKFLKEKVRFFHLGRRDHLPEDKLADLKDLEESTEGFSDYSAALAMDYGGHDELVRAFKKLKDQNLEISAENIGKCLDTAQLPPVDLIIRTGGEQRLSGFMSWQNHYAEFYFPKVYFPDFTLEELDKAIQDFSSRDRRFGGNSVKK